MRILILVLAITLNAGCALFPTPINPVPPWLVAETDYINDRTFNAREVIDDYWFLAGLYYWTGYIPEDEYYDFYYPELRNAEFELGELSRALFPCYGGDYETLFEARQHFENLEDILQTVADELSAVDTDTVCPHQEPTRPEEPKINVGFKT